MRRRSVVAPVGPIVSTIENPHGDQAPVRPITSAATASAHSTALTAGSIPGQHGTFVW